ncbi:MAG: YARHG domain-containing protein [Verrucomicrobiales bacterium]|nr:YARHG domain-containing protein [Verrucomicrobiales bacterium]
MMKSQILALAVCLFFLGSFSGVAQDRTIHVFSVFCNGYTGDGGAINEGVEADKLIVDHIFNEYFSEQSWKVKLRKRALIGADTTKANIVREFAEFSKTVGPEDTIYVHFSGHGVILEQNVGEQFLVSSDEEFLSRKVWADQIDQLPCRLKILITDCCSTYPPDFVVAEGDEEVEPWKNLYSLLLLHQGFVNITAASPGQPAYGTQHGGFLTINLESDMQRFPTWKDVFSHTSTRVYEETKNEIDHRGQRIAPQKPFAYSLGTPIFEDSPQPHSQYVLPDSNQRRLTRSELEAMGLQQLYLARNEIFARHGFDFNSEYLEKYFLSRSWYAKKAGFKSPSLSRVEEANSDLILQVEKQKGGPFIGNRKTIPGGASSGGAAPPDIFPYSSTQTLSRTILQSLSKAELSIARNEMFARHGYPFQSAVLKDYFARKPYYRRNPSASSPKFNAVERHNIWLIEKVERIKGGAYRW